jgi:hypothetical protein
MRAGGRTDGGARALETEAHRCFFRGARFDLTFLHSPSQQQRAHTDDKCLAAPFGAGCVIHSLRLGAPGMTHIRLFFFLRSLPALSAAFCSYLASPPPSAHCILCATSPPANTRLLLAALFVPPKLSPRWPRLAPARLLSHCALLIRSSESICDWPLNWVLVTYKNLKKSVGIRVKK